MEIKRPELPGAPGFMLRIVFSEVIKSHTDKSMCFEYECHFFWHETHLFTIAYTLDIWGKWIFSPN